jgi:hypothetical protein
MKRSQIHLAILIPTLIFFTAYSISADTGKFGVIIGGQGKVPDMVGILKDLGVSWVRVNNHLDGKCQDISRFLEVGINVVITFSNRDPSNLDTAYGSPKEFPNSGYPFKSKEIYQDKIRKALTPLLPYLKQGREIWVQCENEVSDASLNQKARYWRGTTEQYLTQLDAFYEVIKSINSSMPVVLTSFASESLSALIDSSNPYHKFSSTRIAKLLREGKYDAVDLHFYGCIGDIPTKVQWIKELMPEEKLWISTENGGPDYRCSKTPLHYGEDPEEFEIIQAEQVSQRLSACAENGGSVCLWFSLFDMRGESDVFTHMGLIDTSGVMNQGGSFKGIRNGRNLKKESLSKDQLRKIRERLREKPAYDAFKVFVSNQYSQQND